MQMRTPVPNKPSGLQCIHWKKSVLKIQEYIHEGANLKFYIPEFFNNKLLIPEYSPIYRFWFQTAAYFFLQCRGVWMKGWSWTVKCICCSNYLYFISAQLLQIGKQSSARTILVSCSKIVDVCRGFFFSLRFF
jgi:hypothetical protein